MLHLAPLHGSLLLACRGLESAAGLFYYRVAA
jgi:hypothetical protein